MQHVSRLLGDSGFAVINVIARWNSSTVEDEYINRFVATVRSAMPNVALICPTSCITPSKYPQNLTIIASNDLSAHLPLKPTDRVLPTASAADSFIDDRAPLELLVQQELDN